MAALSGWRGPAGALAALCLAGTAVAAGLFEKEVVFSEAEVQAAVDRRGRIERNIGGIVAVALLAPPRVSLDRSDNRAGLAARFDVGVVGNPPLAVDVTGTAGIRYDDGTKAFYLENPVIDSLQAPRLQRELEPAVRRAVSQLMAGYFRTQPVYVLRSDGSAEERAAHWLLRSVRIERGQVVAVLSPF
jgi:hypothetical protein